MPNPPIKIGQVSFGDAYAIILCIMIPVSRVMAGDVPKHEGEEITLKGWVAVRRDHGKIIFIDLRDASGIVQCVISQKAEGEGQKSDIDRVRPEWVVAITGMVNRRPEKLVNPRLSTGEHEVLVSKLEVLNEAQTMPIGIDTDGYEIGEASRMQFRYVDLRRHRMQRNIRLRHKVFRLVREYLDQNNFVEIETPTLTKTSPEGARDFLVPSRLQPGNFYALPQSPQQYKQLLMIAGFERYYQLAHAFRDEDLRGDRQFEHTQIDLEMSFATEQDVRALVEGLIIHVVESCGKKVLQKPFPIFTYDEALKKFGADKFDMRSKKDASVLAFAWVIGFPLFNWDEEKKKYIFAHNPFSAPQTNHIAKLLRGEDLGGLRAQQYDLVCNGYELASGGVRISDPRVQRKVFEIMGLTPEQTEERFGHLIHAYEYGAPPHAGIAPGLDRLVMLLANETTIREVVAFPVSAGGQTSVMSAPSTVDKKQLDELGLEIKKNKKKKS